MEELVKEAEKLLNTPYKPLGYSDKAVDCVGFIALAAHRAKKLPEKYWEIVRTNRDNMARNTKLFECLQEIGEKVPKSEIQRGDVILYKVQGVKYPTHVALAISSEVMIHAYEQARKVCKTNIYNDQNSRIVAVFRIRR